MRGGLLDSRLDWGAAERLHEGFWRRVKTQESLPSEGAARERPEPFRSRCDMGRPPKPIKTRHGAPRHSCRSLCACSGLALAHPAPGTAKGPSGCLSGPRRGPEPTAPAPREVLPMELQGGDRLADETGKWEVVSQPYTTAGGKIAHASVQRATNPPARTYEVGTPSSASA